EVILDTPHQESRRRPMTATTFTARGTAGSQTRLDVQVRDVTLVLDEPTALGGTDQGPNPVEFMLAALMGCMNVVVHVVAKERGIEIRSLEATARGTLDPSRFLGKPTQERAGYSQIDVELEIDSDADDAQLEEIVRHAEQRCPVSDNLLAPTAVTFH